MREHLAIQALIALVVGGGLLLHALRTRRVQTARVQRMAGSSRAVVLGGAGQSADWFTPGLSHGMAVREVNGTITIARMSRITDDALIG